VVRWAKVDSVTLSTPPLTATASGPSIADKTAANRAWKLRPAWSACIAETSLLFVTSASPILIAQGERKRDCLSSQTRAFEMPAMVGHVSGLGLPTFHSPRPLDDFDPQVIAAFRFNRF
jgi:hypothetical protein